MTQFWLQLYRTLDHYPRAQEETDREPGPVLGPYGKLRVGRHHVQAWTLDGREETILGAWGSYLQPWRQHINDDVGYSHFVIVFAGPAADDFANCGAGI